MLARNPHLCGPARSPHFQPAGFFSETYFTETFSISQKRYFSETYFSDEQFTLFQKLIMSIDSGVYDAIYTFVISDNSATCKECGNIYKIQSSNNWVLHTKTTRRNQASFETKLFSQKARG